MSDEITSAGQYRRRPAPKERKKLTPETALKRACIAYLELQGWLTKPWFQQGIVPQNCRGMPDRIAIKNGRHVWLEFKAPGKDLRPDQRLRKAELEAAGAMVLVVHRLEDLYVLGEERQLLLGGR
ncbi:MAG: VRR-NUC domain-containing protein [Spirochaetales bacterium]|nr:VRR-NUC domain-containing protein [Spirochaetales bacterium]